MRRIARNQSGVATIEFALWSSLIFSMLIVSADFGFYAFYKERLKRSVSEASIAAFDSRDNVDPNRIAQYLAASVRIPGAAPTVKVTCNGGNACVNAARTCGCISPSDGSFSAQPTCGSICPSGGLSGYYMNISAQVTFRNVVVANPWLEGEPISANLSVRLQ